MPDEKKICGAKTRAGYPCPNKPIAGRNRCKMHGGKSPGAPITSGNRSNVLKNLDIAGRYEAILNDPEACSHRENIAVHELMIQAELEECQPSVGMWKTAIELAAKVQEEEVSFDKLSRFLMDGLKNARHIETTVLLMDQQRKHKEAESKREHEMNGTLTVVEARKFGEAIIAALDLIEDKSNRLTVATRLELVFGGRSDLALAKPATA